MEASEPSETRENSRMPPRTAIVLTEISEVGFDLDSLSQLESVVTGQSKTTDRSGSAVLSTIPESSPPTPSRNEPPAASERG